MSIFTPDEVKSLNGYQEARYFHPFTCGSGNRTDEHHLDREGVLVATEDGWKCPYCDYTQDWAHEWMKNGEWESSRKTMTMSMQLFMTARPNVKS